MTAGGRSNSSGAGVSSLVSGSGKNDRVWKINKQNEIKMKVNHNYDTNGKVYHISDA